MPWRMNFGLETRARKPLSEEAVMLTKWQSVGLKHNGGGFLVVDCNWGPERKKGQSYLHKNERKIDACFESWVDTFPLLTVFKSHLVTHGWGSEMCLQHRDHPKVLGASLLASSPILPSWWPWRCSHTGKLGDGGWGPLWWDLGGFKIFWQCLPQISGDKELQLRTS